MVDIDRVLSILSTSKKQTVHDYYDYVLKYETKTEIIDVEEDKILLLKENSYYMEGILEAAKEFRDKELQSLGKKVDDLCKDKVLRQELIVKLRKNSSLTLKEIGGLVGGISQSMVCKILRDSRLR